MTLKSLTSQFLPWVKSERGQDLVEYALVVALIAFSATAGERSLATKINAAFTTIGTNVTTYTS